MGKTTKLAQEGPDVRQEQEHDGFTITWREHVWDIGVYSDPGKRRDHNEDSMSLGFSVCTWPHFQGLVALADGVGSQARGEQASARAVQLMQQHAQVAPSELGQLIRATNRSLVQEFYQPHAVPEAQPTTTIVAALLTGSRVQVGNVGDSRAYLVRGQHMAQISKDHVDAYQDGALTLSLGIEEQVTPELWQADLVGGDQLLLCSDGLTKELSDSDIHRMLVQQEQSPVADAVGMLGFYANERGGRDNITMILIRYSHVPEDAGGRYSLGREVRLSLLIPLLTIAIVVAAVLWLALQ